MANKKKNSKKKTTSSKEVQNKKKVQQDEYNKKIDSVGEFDADYKRILIVVGVIAIVFCSFYLLTVYLTGRDTKKATTTSTDATISYTDTIAGRSFSMPENEYLILYYDHSDTELLSAFSSVVSDYRSDDSHYALYGVDMSNAMNKSYASDSGNTNPSSVSELAINGPTLIHFKEGSVVNYVEGVTDITNYLK